MSVYLTYEEYKARMENHGCQHCEQLASCRDCYEAYLRSFEEVHKEKKIGTLPGDLQEASPFSLDIHNVGARFIAPGIASEDIQ